MKKKILAALLSGVLALSCMACGGNETQTSEVAKTTESTVTSESATTPSEPKEVVTIKFLSGESAKKTAFEKVITAYNEGQGKEKGIYVELEVNTDYKTVIEVGQQNGQLPDICRPSTQMMKKFSASGDLIPIEDFPGGAEFIAEINSPEVKDNNMYDGKMYHPCVEVQTAGLVINVDLFKAAGLVDANGDAKAPTTWEELKEYAKILTNPKENVYGMGFAYKSGGVNSYYLERPFANSIQPKSEYINYDELTVSTRGAEDLFQLMIDMNKDGSLFPGAETLDNDTLRAYFAEGKIAMIPSVSWDVGVFTTQFPAKNEWKVVEAPVKDVNETYPNWCAYAGGYCLTKTALEHPEEAFDFYQYYFSDEVQSIIAMEAGVILVDTELYSTLEVDEHALQYAALYDPDYDLNPHPTYTIEGEKEADLYAKAWYGEMTPEQAAEAYAAATQTALRKAVEEGTTDFTGFINK